MHLFRLVRFNFDSLHVYGAHGSLVEKPSPLNMGLCCEEAKPSPATEWGATDFEWSLATTCSAAMPVADRRCEIRGAALLLQASLQVRCTPIGIVTGVATMAEDP